MSILIKELARADFKVRCLVTEIVKIVGVKQSTVSHHLAILKEAGLVNTRNEGKHSFYELNQKRVETCCGQILQVFAPESEIEIS